MSHYMGVPTGKPSGTLITQALKDKVFGEKLRGSCQEVDNRFKCVVAYQGKKYTFDKHDTIALCNAQYDHRLAKIKAKVTHKPRLPAAKGYRVRELADGTRTYHVSIALSGKMEYIGMRKTEKAARGLYLETWVEYFGPIPEEHYLKELADKYAVS